MSIVDHMTMTNRVEMDHLIMCTISLMTSQSIVCEPNERHVNSLVIDYNRPYIFITQVVDT